MPVDRKPYRQYPPPVPKSVAMILVGLLLLFVVVMTLWATDGKGATTEATFQGKDVQWWAGRAQQARRDANARSATIRRLRRSLHYSPAIGEAITLATIVYPSFTATRAWQIIDHESGMTPDPTRAVNPTAIGSEHASGLYQFLPSTFASTPYGRLSIWSPYAQSLAAAWMHSHGRGCEWEIGAGC